MEILVLNDADLRVQCRKRIRRYFRPGVRDGGEQSRFSRVWIADQAHLRDEPQLEKILPFVACLPRLREPWSLAARCCKIAITEASPAPFAQNKLLAVL